MTPLYVGITGSHVTGRSTLADRIAMELRAEGVVVATAGSGLARQAAQLGFPKLRDHTLTSTSWVIAAGAAAELAAGIGAQVVITTRTPYDALAYYLAAREHHGEQPAPAELERLTALARTHAHYETVLATVLDPGIPIGDHPDSDEALRAAVDRHVHHVLGTTGAAHCRVGAGDHAAAVADTTRHLLTRLEAK